MEEDKEIKLGEMSIPELEELIEKARKIKEQKELAVEIEESRENINPGDVYYRVFGNNSIELFKIKENNDVDSFGSRIYCYGEAGVLKHLESVLENSIFLLRNYNKINIDFDNIVEIYDTTEKDIDNIRTESANRVEEIIRNAIKNQS